MTALEAPIEALAFSYLSFSLLTAVNSVWTWIAVFTTAAVSVWRIRTSSPQRVHQNLDVAWLPSSPVERVVAEQPESNSFESASVCRPATAAVVPDFEREGRTRSKFTMYFEDEHIYEYNDDVAAVERDDRKELHRFGDDWRAIMNVRVENMGLYCHQDLTVLDGSIVRLWEGCRRRRTVGLTAFGGDVVVTW